MIMQNIQFTNMLIWFSDYGDDNHRGGEGYLAGVRYRGANMWLLGEGAGHSCKMSNVSHGAYLLNQILAFKFNKTE